MSTTWAYGVSASIGIAPSVSTVDCGAVRVERGSAAAPRSTPDDTGDGERQRPPGRDPLGVPCLEREAVPSGLLRNARERAEHAVEPHAWRKLPGADLPGDRLHARGGSQLRR